MTVETTAAGQSAIDRKRVAELTEREMAKLTEGTPASKERYERGEGTKVWDVDGHEYVDFHNGFGVMCIGHANPTVGAAVKARVELGTHFAAPTDGSIVVAEELRRRFGLPQWRFTNWAPNRRWTPSTSPAAPPAATACSRSRAHTTATTTR